MAFKQFSLDAKLRKFYLFVAFQDCKEFQGELFGICNLFRDLSDKLFTSEIIELHEKQGQEPERRHHRKQESNELVKISVSSEQDSTIGPEITTISSDAKNKKTSSKPTLEDLGKFIFWYFLLQLYLVMRLFIIIFLLFFRSTKRSVVQFLNVANSSLKINLHSLSMIYSHLSNK